MSAHTDRLEPLADLVARVDLGALVEHYSGPGKRQGARTVYTCPNPAHADAHPSFDVRRDLDGVERGRCRSQCAWSGDALDLVEWVEGLDRPRAIERLRSWTGTPDPAHYRPTRPTPARKPLAPLPDTRPVPEDTARRLMAAYLTRRGWPADTPGRFGLSVVLDERGHPRIRHPFTVPDGAGGTLLVTWQDRATGNVTPRWWAPEGRPLPPWNVAALEADDVTAAVICEGPADGITAALALERVPGVAVVAIPGTNGWRTEWAEMFAGLVVVLVTDADDAGRKFGESLAGELAGIAATVRRAPLQSGANDLSDLCAASGLEVVRRLLLAALNGRPPDPDPSPDEDEHDLRGELLEALGLGTVTDDVPEDSPEMPDPERIAPAARRLTRTGTPCEVCGRPMLAGQGPRGAHYTCRPEPGQGVRCTCHPNPDYREWVRLNVLPANPDARLPDPCPVHEADRVEVVA